MPSGIYRDAVPYVALFGLALFGIVVPSFAQTPATQPTAYSVQDIVQGITARQFKLSECHVHFHWTGFYGGDRAGEPFSAADFDVIQSQNRLLVRKSITSHLGDGTPMT